MGAWGLPGNLRPGQLVEPQAVEEHRQSLAWPLEGCTGQRVRILVEHCAHCSISARIVLSVRALFYQCAHCSISMRIVLSMRALFYQYAHCSISARIVLSWRGHWGGALANVGGPNLQNNLLVLADGTGLIMPPQVGPRRLPARLHALCAVRFAPGTDAFAVHAFSRVLSGMHIRTFGCACLSAAERHAQRFPRDDPRIWPRVLQIGDRAAAPGRREQVCSPGITRLQQSWPERLNSSLGATVEAGEQGAAMERRDRSPLRRRARVSRASASRTARAAPRLQHQPSQPRWRAACLRSRRTCRRRPWGHGQVRRPGGSGAGGH